MFNWKVMYEENRNCKRKEFKTISEIENSGCRIIKATVPGNIEMDFEREGILPDIYYSDNTTLVQNFENLHLWYFTEFYVEDVNSFIEFEGIDNYSDIYVNGVFIKSTDNMTLTYNIFPQLNKGKNEMVVHIKPATIEARKFDVSVKTTCQPYNYESMYVRKAPHSYGWDIMPRIVSAGIWKNVNIKPIKEDKINEVYINVKEINEDNCIIKFFMSCDMKGDFARDYTYKIEGRCKDRDFIFNGRMFHNMVKNEFEIKNPYLWWPKPVGEPCLYETKISLYYKEELVDTYSLNIGLRTIYLDRTDTTDSDGNGKFYFIVNNKPVFVLGTNWVPLDALHSRDLSRLNNALYLLDDIGCNMVRCWGGNVYEAEEFYDFCDSHGIMVWQDFMMACGIYPQDKYFIEKLEEEAAFQIKRLRNHPSIALWSGDNECDYQWNVEPLNPNDNILTRETLKKAVRDYDYSRSYLPSSPYMSQKAIDEGNVLVLPEQHLWGPRDYFKGKYYSTFTHFASEIGYHGFNNLSSLKKFLKEPEKIYEENKDITREYLVHSTCVEPLMDSRCAYRIPLAVSQVETLFGKKEENFNDFIKQSQISQGEAKKYFIEKFRIYKEKRGGIIWWNLIDGWPQVSDAIVDYYYSKKIAYHYIKRCQEPICFMFDEPCDNKISLVGVNDYTYEKEAEYKVTCITDNREVAKGKVILTPETSIMVDSVSILPDEQKFYLIEWKIDNKIYKNHYYTGLLNINYNNYINDLKKAGMYEFEE